MYPTNESDSTRIHPAQHRQLSGTHACPSPGKRRALYLFPFSKRLWYPEKLRKFCARAGHAPDGASDNTCTAFGGALSSLFLAVSLAEPLRTALLGLDSSVRRPKDPRHV